MALASGHISRVPSGADPNHGRHAQSQRLRNLPGAGEMDMAVDAVSRQQLAFAANDFGGHAHHHAGHHAGHNVRIASFANAHDANVLDADIGLEDAGAVNDQRVGDDQIQRVGWRDADRLAYAVARHLTAAGPAFLAVHSVVTFLHYY